MQKPIGCRYCGYTFCDCAVPYTIMAISQANAYQEIMDIHNLEFEEESDFINITIKVIAIFTSVVLSALIFIQ